MQTLDKPAWKAKAKAARLQSKTLKINFKAHHHWLENIQLEVSIAASHGNGDVIPHDLGSNHGHRLALGRVHLAFKRSARRVQIRHTHGFMCRFTLGFTSNNREGNLTSENRVRRVIRQSHHCLFNETNQPEQGGLGGHELNHSTSNE